MKYIFFLCFSFSFLISCNNKPVISIENTITQPWLYESPLVFQLNISDNNKTYDLLLNLTHSTDFKYKNLYVKITTEFPDNTKVEDVLSMNLIGNSGIFIGDCNSKTCSINISLEEKFKFKSSGIHKLTIYQNSRTDNLSGILSGKLMLFYAK
ncbi:MAG: hypothetical protein V3V14_13570 [Saprospiraceae bacterium]